MPKIEASTVAEHHDLHFERLLDAALDYVADHEVASLTLAELAKRTGRSRASLYAYFGSADEMRMALCTRALASWVDALIDELRLVERPDERLARYVTAQIADRRDPSVERISAFVMSLQSEPFRSQVRSVLEPLTTELLSIIEQLGVAPPTRAATVVQGAIAAAYDQVRAGGDPDDIADDTVAFVRAGLSALRHSGSTPPPTGGADPNRSALGGGRAHGASHRVVAPGALAMTAGPSLAAVAAVAVPATAGANSTRRAPLQQRRVGVARLAVAQLGWAVAAFTTGATGAGGAAVHTALGVSLVVILAWSVRTLAPARLAPPGLVTMMALAAVVSAVALIARYQPVDGALATHVLLALLLLAGLTSVARSAWNNRHQPIRPPNLI